MRLHYFTHAVLVTVVIVASSGFSRAQFDARVQAIHNAPDPLLEFVDLYVEDMLVLDDVEFRTASPFIDVPGLFPLTGGLAPGNSTGPEDVFFEFTFTLTPGDTYQFILKGVVDPKMFLPNPDGRDISLDVLVNDNARELAADPGTIDVLTIHGGTDAPTLDLLPAFTPLSDESAGVVFADDIAYSDITEHVTIDFSGFPVTVISADETTVNEDFYTVFADFGEAITLVVTGFLDPAGNQNGEEFAPMVVHADGRTDLLHPFPVSVQPEEIIGSDFTLHGNYPNPFNESTAITFDLAETALVSMDVFDVFGRKILTAAPTRFPAGTAKEIQFEAGSIPSGSYFYRVLAVMNGTMHSLSGHITLLK